MVSPGVPPISSAAAIVAGRLAVSCYSWPSFSSPDIARRRQPDAQPPTPRAALNAVPAIAQRRSATNRNTSRRSGDAAHAAAARLRSMPTPSEKKALGFLAVVAVVGASVRMSGAVASASAADASSREALRRQIVAAESAGAVERRNRRGGGATVGKRRSSGHPVAPRANTDSARTTDPRDLFNAPPVIPPTRASKPTTPAVPVDVDRASASELEALPRIGPALAKRIIDDREARGPFGSLAGFQRVRGVGPAMAAALSASVTFSGTPRPSIAGGPRASGSSRTRGARRRGAPP